MQITTMFKMKYLLVVLAALLICAGLSSCNKHGYKTIPCPHFSMVSL